MPTQTVTSENIEPTSQLPFPSTSRAWSHHPPYPLGYPRARSRSIIRTAAASSLRLESRSLGLAAELSER